MPDRPGLRLLLRALGRRLPRTRGVVRVHGLRSQVSVARDRWGIPHVDAATDEDAWFGLGFCHGQDRGFQLELLGRAGRGRLSELVGPATLPIDRLSLTLGFARVAAAQAPVLDPGVRRVLEAYVAGINAATASAPRPHELVMLRASPTPWTMEDVLAFMGLQALALAGNWDTELARLAILQADGPDALRAVEPRYASWLPVTVPVGAPFGEAIDRLADDVALLRGLAGGGGASNAWAVSGSRTRTGRPILANDPHLAPSVPAPWYLAHLRTPDWEVAGASFVGGPAFPSAHNGQIAWGVTAACTDSADLFWEELDLEAGTARGPNGAEAVDRIAVEIPVRGGPVVREEILVTARGPILTPLLDGVSMALSVRATWLEAVPVRGFLGIERARDFDSFRRPFAEWPGPALNVVYADRDGHVGWQVVGTLPRRCSGSGMVPLPAWEPNVGWRDEHLPFDELPWAFDPSGGFVASANNAPRPDAPDLPFLGADWLDGYRAAGIVARLSERSDWDVEATRALQLDVTSRPWAQIREIVLGTATDDADASLALRLLRTWDGEVAAGSVGASVYELVVSELAAALARARAPGGWRWAIGAGFGESVPRTSFGARTVSGVVAALRAGDLDPSTVEAALAASVSVLRERFGPGSDGWAWGHVRPLRLLHPFGARRPLDRVFNLGPVPLGGDANTVAQAGVRPIAPLDNPAAIPNLRTVIDLDDPDRSRFVLAGGQSGNPVSRHYADQFRRWCIGEAVPIPWSRSAVEEASVDRLLLRPSGKPPVSAP